MANIDKVTLNGTDYKLIDSTVPSWAKQSTKPSYTANEVGAVPTTRTVNGKALSSNITLSASDVSADVFVVNIESDGNDGYTCDKTNAEIYAAWQAGRNIVLTTGSGFLYKLSAPPGQTYCEFSGDDYDDICSYRHYSIFTRNGQQRVIEGYAYFQEYLQSGTNIKTINNQSLLGSGNLTPSDLGAITRFVVDFTLSGTTISNPNKTFLEIKAAYDAGNLVLARDNNSSLYYLLYCDTENCGFFNCDSNYLYDINVDSNNVWRYQITDISQLSHDLSNKSEVIYMRKVNNVWRKLTYDSLNGNWIIDSAALTTGSIKNIYFDKDNNDLYYWDGSAFVLVDEDNVQPDWNQSDSTKADYIKNKPVIPNSVKVGSVAGKLYRNDVNGSGNFTVKGNSGCIPNLIAGTFFVSIYAKSATQSYTFRFNFGSVSYDLSTTNGEINDVRQITIPSSGTFSGLVANGSVASGTILYVVMYNYLAPISTVGPAAVTNRYSDLDGTPTIPTVNNGTLTIQKNGTTVQTFTANLSGSVTANIIVPTTASDIGALPSSTHIPADQVQSNWNETNTSSKAYILNKPSLAIEIVTNSSSGSVTQAMDANKFYKFTGSPTSITITLNSALGLGVYGGKFTANVNGTTLVLPSSVTVASSAPSIEGGNTYEFNIADNVLLMVEV